MKEKVIYANRTKCRYTADGAAISFKRFLSIEEEDRRLIGSHVFGIVARACSKEGSGRNPVILTARYLQAIEDGRLEILYRDEGTVEVRRLPALRVVH